jgi:glutamyl-tRNA synthetase
VGTGPPRFGHLPLVTGEGSKKMSKRDPQSSLDVYRERGFLPEGLLNYLALLGWSIADDRDIFSMAEMAAAFDVAKVSPNPARFDLRKAEAINAVHLRSLEPMEFQRRVRPYLVSAGLLSDPATEAQLRLLSGAAPLVQERMNVLSEAAGLLRFLFTAEQDFTVEPDSAAKVFDDSAVPILHAAAQALGALPNWAAAEIEVALKTALVEELGIKPRKAFAPIRVAVCGRTVSPPLYESLELLGRERSLLRLNAAAGR